MKLRWKLWAGVTGVFLAGFLCGALAIVVVASLAGKKAKQARVNPEVTQEMITGFLVRRLELNDAQEAEVDAVVGDLVEEWIPIRERARAEVRATLERHGPRIEAVLETDTQRERYQRFLEKVERDWSLGPATAGQDAET